MLNESGIREDAEWRPGIADQHLVELSCDPLEAEIVVDATVPEQHLLAEIDLVVELGLRVALEELPI